MVQVGPVHFIRLQSSPKDPYGVLFHLPQSIFFRFQHLTGSECVKIIFQLT